MIVEGTGNLLAADVQALVNTVNTVGVMGKGIALQFKRAFPANYAVYRAACERGEVQLGSMLVHDRAVSGRHRYIINFPTKGHWRSPSRLPDVEAGLTDLVRIVRELGITSIAVPALGCGNGGLQWRDVRPRIEQAFADLPDLRVVVFAPHGAPDPASMPTATTRPKMTTGRAVLVAALARYAEMARLVEPRTGVSELEIQKIAYALQLLGAPLRLQFATGHYGPYAEALHHVLQTLEGHQLIGYGDRSAKVAELRPITVTPGAEDEATAFLAGDRDSLDRLDRLEELVTGYETPYALELLTTVHFVAHHSPPSADSAVLIERVARWSSRKAQLFTPHHIAVAAAHLADFGLMPDRDPAPAGAAV
jgi:O-acetyl-ADP-ribose deacetylase (regulator of RNase III)